MLNNYYYSDNADLDDILDGVNSTKDEEEERLRELEAEEEISDLEAKKQALDELIKGIDDIPSGNISTRLDHLEWGNVPSAYKILKEATNCIKCDISAEEYQNKWDGNFIYALNFKGIYDCLKFVYALVELRRKTEEYHSKKPFDISEYHQQLRGIYSGYTGDEGYIWGSQSSSDWGREFIVDGIVSLPDDSSRSLDIRVNSSRGFDEIVREVCEVLGTCNIEYTTFDGFICDINFCGEDYISCIMEVEIPGYFSEKYSEYPDEGYPEPNKVWWGIDERVIP